MKKIINLSVAVFAVALFLGTSSVQAASQNANVRATLNGQCFANDAAAVLVDLGAVSFTAGSSDALAAVSGNVSFWCTKGTNYTATSSVGAVSGVGEASTLTDAVSTDTVAYTVSITGANSGAGVAGVGAGKATPFNVAVSGAVAAAAFDNVSAGVYEEAVTITVLP